MSDPTDTVSAVAGAASAVATAFAVYWAWVTVRDSRVGRHDDVRGRYFEKYVVDVIGSFCKELRAISAGLNEGPDEIGDWSKRFNRIVYRLRSFVRVARQAWPPDDPWNVVNEASEGLQDSVMELVARQLQDGGRPDYEAAVGEKCDSLMNMVITMDPRVRRPQASMGRRSGAGGERGVRRFIACLVGRFRHKP